VRPYYKESIQEKPLFREKKKKEKKKKEQKSKYSEKLEKYELSLKPKLTISNLPHNY
jgi:hypothetical protein